MPRRLRVVALAAAGLMTGVACVVLALYVVGGRKLSREFAIADETVTLPVDSSSLAEGERLSIVLGCTDCHAANLAGRAMIDAPIFAVLPGTNLTRGSGGVGAGYAAADFERAIRHGVDVDGRPLMIMPSADYAHLADDDVGRLVAYLLQVPAVDNVVPDRSVGLVGRVASALVPRGLLPAYEIDHQAEHRPSVARGVTIAFGEYLTRPCRSCHGADLGGGRVPGAGDAAPPAVSLIDDGSSRLGAWSETDFVRALKEGIRPDGSRIDSAMPWQTFALHTDEELGAMWAYLSSRASAGD